MNARVPPCLLVVALLSAPALAESNVEALRGLHAKALQAHLASDIDMLLADEAEEYVVASRGEVSRPTLAERREFLGPYLRATTFEEYADVHEPIVRVSADGTLGWVIATVRARGFQKRAEGEPRPLEFTSAWIELYEKRNGRWLRTGNVSNFAG